MTTTYVRLTDTDKPESQTAITASFVDETGKHIDIGGGGTTEIHTDNTLAGHGTTGNPLKLSADTNSKIEKAGTITDDNLKTASPINETDVVCVAKSNNGSLCLKFTPASGLGVYTTPSSKLDSLYVRPASVSQRGTVTIGDNMSVDTSGRISVPAITSIKNIDVLSGAAVLTDVVNKVNEILNAVKTAADTSASANMAIAANAITNTGLGKPSIGSID